jgi:hypothetical protein
VRRSPSELQVAWRALGQALADGDARAVAFWRRRLRELAQGQRAERAPRSDSVMPFALRGLAAERTAGGAT